MIAWEEAKCQTTGDYQGRARHRLRKADGAAGGSGEAAAGGDQDYPMCLPLLVPYHCLPDCAPTAVGWVARGSLTDFCISAGQF